MRRRRSLLLIEIIQYHIRFEHENESSWPGRHWLASADDWTAWRVRGGCGRSIERRLTAIGARTHPREIS